MWILCARCTVMRFRIMQVQVLLSIDEQTQHAVAHLVCMIIPGLRLVTTAFLSERYNTGQGV
jgi:hypothetical protein